MIPEHITLTELSKLTKRHLVYLSYLIKNGTLPVGYKVKTARYVPQEESLLALSKLSRRNRQPRNKAPRIETIDDLLA